MKKFQYFLLLVFFIANSAYRLGTGFDAMFVRGSFLALFTCMILFNQKIKITPILKWGLLFWGYYFLSILWAPNPSATLKSLNGFVQIYGVYFFISNLIEDKEDVKTVIKLLIVSSLYTMILLALRTPVDLYGSERIGEVIGQNPNTFGMIMATSAVLTFYLVKTDNEQKKRLPKIVYYILILLFSIFSLLSGSKKALILLGGGLVGLEIFVNHSKKKLKGILTVIIVVPLALFFIFHNEKLYSVLGYRLEKTYLTITNQYTSTMKDGSLLEREYFQKTAMELFKKHPIIGYGGNNFSTYLRSINYSDPAYSHNNFTELLSTLGIIGFIIYYYFIGSTIWKLYKILKNKKEKEMPILLLILMLLFLALDYGLVSYIEVFNAIILAIAASYVCLNEKEVKVNEN